jgi:CIC family chloride channel protein
VEFRIRNLDYLKKWLVIGIFLGVAAGIGALIFYYMIIYAQQLFLGQIAGTQLPNAVGEGSITYVPGNYLLVPVSIIIGGLLSGLIVYKFAPEAEGHGTDAMIDAFHNKKGKVRRRIPIVKAVASAITIGSGGSAGREGPTAQIAAGIGSWLSDVFKLTPDERRIAVLVGTGAGIGTIFKAPIGGALLALEIPYKRDFETNALFPAIVASAIGYSIFGSIVGFQPIFGYYLDVFNPLNLPLFAILGIVTGAFVIFYVKTFYKTKSLFKSLRINRYFKPMLGAICVAAIVFVFPEVMGVGYGWVQIMINSGIQSFPTYGLPILAILILLPFAKVIATSFSIGSGGSGGVFAPGIFIGASIGLLMGLLFHYISPSIATSVAPFVIIGALAFMGAAGKVPISVLLMVTEMTGSLQLLPGAMVAVALSYLLSGKHTIYYSQVETRKDSPAHKHEYDKPILQNMRINRLKPIDLSVSTDKTVAYALERMHKLDLSELPVIDLRKDKKIIGKISATDLSGLKDSTRISKVRTEPIHPIDHHSATARQALNAMSKSNTSWAAVTLNGRYVGCITLADIEESYGRTLGMALSEQNA